MSDGRRVQRVEKELRQIVASFLVSGIRVPFPGVVTVAEISVNPDMRTGKVFLSYLGPEEDRSEVEEIIEDHKSDIQRHIGKQLTMKFCPKLKFFVNQSQSTNPELDAMIARLGQSGD